MQCQAALHRLSGSFHQDILWWDRFLHVFNGTRLFLDLQPTIDVMTDSCSLSAGGDWFYFNFAIDNPSWSHLHSNHKETLAIVLAAKRWAPQWANHRVIIHSDNQAAVFIINKGTTDNDRIMGELRDLFWLSAAFNLHISAIYIQGSCNTIADAISRLHESQHLHAFYSILQERQPQLAADDIPLTDHMSVHSRYFVFSRCTGSPTGHAATPGNS